MPKERKYLLGIDLGGSWVRFVTARESDKEFDFKAIKKSKKQFQSPFVHGATLFKEKQYTNLPDGRKAGIYLAETTSRYLRASKLKPEDIAAVGVAVPGKMLNHETFIGANIPENLLIQSGSLAGVDIITSLRKLFSEKTPIVLENDGNAAGTAQAAYYNSKGIDGSRTFFIAIGTGIAGGGPQRNIYEVGHVVIDGFYPAFVPRCGCGVIGCVEAFASGRGLAAVTGTIMNAYFNEPDVFRDFCRYEAQRMGFKYELEKAVEKSKVADMYRKSGEVLPQTIFEEVASNSTKNGKDLFASYLVDLMASKIARLLISLANIERIDIFGVGGSVVFNNPWVLKLVKEEVDKLQQETREVFKNRFKVVLTPYGELAVDIGALSLARG